MGAQAWVELLDTMVADTAGPSNTTVETILAPDFSIPGYYMVPGRTIEYHASGVLSNVVTTPGTLIIRLRWGGVAGVLLLATTALGLDTTAHANGGSAWEFNGRVVCRTAGATGTFLSSGRFDTPDVLTSTAGNLVSHIMTSTGTNLHASVKCNDVVTVDTTVAKSLSLTAQFSVSTAGTNITSQERIIKVLN